MFFYVNSVRFGKDNNCYSYCNKRFGEEYITIIFPINNK